MSIRWTLDEAWQAVGSAHTGILTTLRRDGVPIAPPVWFAVEDRTVVMMTPAGTKKIARVRRDPRASFLVESGERYVDLSAVHLTGRVEFVGDAAATARIEAAVDEKYTPNRFSCASCRTAES
jgi:PPOX class probable F420-dependent enzyme